MAATPPPFANYATTPTAGADVPGTGPSASQDSIYGISKTLAQVPVALSITRDTGKMHQGLSADPQGGGNDAPIVETQNWQTVLSSFFDMSPQDRAVAQQQMLRAGFYPSSFYGSNPPTLVPGEADANSYTAWRNLVEQTVRESAYDDASKSLKNPKTIAQVLQERISNRQAQGVDTSGAPQQPQVNVSSPDDIRAVLLAEAKQQYGRNAPEDLVNSLITRYQQLQAQAQTSNDPTVVKPPDLTSFASAQLQAADPNQVAANRGLQIGNLFMQAFGASAGNQPTPSGASGG